MAEPTPEIEIVATGLRFPEGPVALSDGSILVVEIASGTLTRVDPDGDLTILARCGGGPNGAALGPDGALYVCNNGGQEFVERDGRFLNSLVNQGASYIGGRIQRVDLETGVVDDLYTECEGNRLCGPNDLVFDASGGFWFTDSGKNRARGRDWGAVYYARPDGSSIVEVIHPLDSPNGIGLSPAGNRLYVADTTTGRIWWWTVTEPGVVEHDKATGRGRHLFAAPAGAPFFDSIAMEAGGAVCVGTLFSSGITTFHDDGRSEFLELPDRLVTNLCFTGDDMRTAYVTLSSGGQLARVRWPRPGLRLPWTDLESTAR